MNYLIVLNTGSNEFNRNLTAVLSDMFKDITCVYETNVFNSINKWIGKDGKEADTALFSMQTTMSILTHTLMRGDNIVVVSVKEPTRMYNEFVHLSQMFNYYTVNVISDVLDIDSLSYGMTLSAGAIGVDTDMEAVAYQVAEKLFGLLINT